MNDNVIQDLKQFIDAAVAQQTTDVRAEIADVRSDIKSLDTKLDSKIDDLSSSVAEALEHSNHPTNEQLHDHEQRISKLEQKAA